MRRRTLLAAGLAAAVAYALPAQAKPRRPARIGFQGGFTRGLR